MKIIENKKFVGKNFAEEDLVGLHNAKTAKNDEYYTRYEDIEAELSNYSSFFSGKSVFCPCDDYDISNFVKYFKSNFEALGLKALYSSCRAIYIRIRRCRPSPWPDCTRTHFQIFSKNFSFSGCHAS